MLRRLRLRFNVLQSTAFSNSRLRDTNFVTKTTNWRDRKCTHNTQLNNFGSWCVQL